MSLTYSPNSHFITNVAALISANASTDSFGPVPGQQTTQYRTTSTLRVNALSKAYAICSGRFMLQPQTDLSKINLILKPDNANYGPFKIKYFIYRGLRKSDWITPSVQLPLVNPSDANQPPIIKKLWDQFVQFNNYYFQKGIITGSQPDKIFMSQLGYNPDSQSETSLIDQYFYATKDDSNSDYFALPGCAAGDHLGNFDSVLGLDILLDNGDFQDTLASEPYQLDLKFARKDRNVIDVTSMIGSTDPQILANLRRTREAVHLFLDPAAFWGSHINNGKISAINASNSIILTSGQDVFTSILSKYSTGTSLYIYIKTAKGRTYNYFDVNKPITGLSGVTKNETSGWPILILSNYTNQSITTTTTTLTFQLKASASANGRGLGKRILTNIFCPGQPIENPKILDIPVLDQGPGVSGNLKAIEIQVPIGPGANNTIGYYASFSMIEGVFDYMAPIHDSYVNNLWPAALKPVITAWSTGADATEWAVDRQNPLVDFDKILDVGANVGHKIFLDTGQQAGSSPATKKRRTYLAVIKENTSIDASYSRINVNTLTAGFAPDEKSLASHNVNLFGDSAFSVYKGKITDGTVISSLSLIHGNDYEKKYAFFVLGITDDDYNKLLYNNNTPAAQTVTIPSNAANIYFYLEELADPIADVSIIEKVYKKYKLNLSYEDLNGSIVVASPNTPIYVYTVDGFYFFTKDYSDYQNKFKEFAAAQVELRPEIGDSSLSPIIPAYAGEFGFDWIRDGDNGEKPYADIIESGFKGYSGGIALGYTKKEAVKALKYSFPEIPTKLADKLYPVPFLKLFSPNFNFMGGYAPPISALLRVFVKIDAPVSRLEFDYDPRYFTVTPKVLSDTQIRGKQLSVNKRIRIDCQNDFDQTQQIRVLAYPPGTTSKADALLAGLLMVERNSVLSIKKMNILLVKVTVMPRSSSATGVFSPDELSFMNKYLSQLFIYGKTVQIGLNLQNDANFKSGQPFIKMGGIQAGASGLYAYLNNKINQQAPAYTNYFKIFCFENDGYDGNDQIGGRAEGFNTKSVCIFLNRRPFTLSHEMGHCLGLKHSHSDNTQGLPEVDQNYIFPKYNPATPNPDDVTDNVMSYNPDRTSTWHWQFKIANKRYPYF